MLSLVNVLQQKKASQVAVSRTSAYRSKPTPRNTVQNRNKSAVPMSTPSFLSLLAGTAATLETAAVTNNLGSFLHQRALITD